MDHWGFTCEGGVYFNYDSRHLESARAFTWTQLHLSWPHFHFRHGWILWEQKIYAALWSWPAGEISWLGPSLGTPNIDHKGFNHWGHLGTGLREAEEETLTEGLKPSMCHRREGSGQGHQNGTWAWMSMHGQYLPAQEAGFSPTHSAPKSKSSVIWLSGGEGECGNSHPPVHPFVSLFFFVSLFSSY